MALNVLSGQGSLYFATGIDNRGLKRDATQSKGIIKGLAGSVSRMDVFAGLGISAGLAFTKMASDAKKFSEDFEQAMREVQTISTAVTEDYDGMSQKIIDLSKEVPDTAEQLTKAYYQIVSAGYDGAKGLTLLESASKAAVGGVSDVLTSADGLTTVLNAWKIEAGEVDSVSDALFQTVKLGKTTFGELSSGISQVAPLAASMNISLEEVLGSIATLTKQGVPTSMAITQIRSSLISMNEVLGDGWSNQMTYQEGLAKIREMAGGSQSKLREMVGRIEAMNAVLGTTGANAEMAASDLENLRNSTGASTAAFDKMVVSSINQSKILKNNFRAALKPLGDFMSETGTDFARFMNEAFASGEIEKWVKVLKAAGITLAAYKTTTVLTKISMMDYKRALVIARRAQQALNLAIKKNPVGLLVAALGAAITAFIAFRNKSKEAAEGQDEFNEMVQKGNEILVATKSIEEKMKLVNHMNKRQLEDLKTNIQGQLQAEQDFTVDLKKELVKRLEEDERLKDLKEQYAAETTGANKAFLAQQIRNRKLTLAEELEAEYSKHQKSENALREHLTNINKALKNLPEDEKKEGEGENTTVKNYLDDLKQQAENAKGVLENMTNLIRDGLTPAEKARIENQKEILRTIQAQIREVEKLISLEATGGKRVDVPDKLTPKDGLVTSVEYEKQKATALAQMQVVRMINNEKRTSYRLTEEEDDALRNVFATANQVSDSIRDINPELADSLDKTIGISTNLMDAAVGFSSGNIMQGITGAVGLVTSIVDEFTTSAEEAAQAQLEYNDALLASIDAMNRSLDRQIQLLDEMHGMTWVENTKQAIKEVEDAQIESADTVAQYSMKYSQQSDNKYWDWSTFNYGKHMEEKNIDMSQFIDKDGLLAIDKLIEFQTMLKEGDFKGLKDEFGVEGLINNPEQVINDIDSMIAGYDELMAKERELYEQLFEDLTGMTSESLESGIIEGFEAGKSGVEILEESLNEMFQKTLMEQFKNKFIEEQLAGFYEDYGNMIADNDLSEADREAARTQLAGILNTASAGFEEYSNMLAELGIETDAMKEKGLQGAIKGMTEQTAGMLAGYMNAIRMNTAELLINSQATLDSLNEIATNTRYNRHLEEIRDLLSDSQTTDTLRATGR